MGIKHQSSRLHRPAVPTVRAFWGLLACGYKSHLFTQNWVMNPLSPTKQPLFSGYRKTLEMKMRNRENYDTSEKTRFALFVKGTTLDLVKDMYEKSGCKTQSDYIEKAILFYTGYLRSERDSDYLSSVILSSMKNYSEDEFKTVSGMLFKVAVELAMMNNILAFNFNIDKATLREVREECERVVRLHNGNFSLKDAIDWQKG